MTTAQTPDRVTAIYDAIDAFQRTHRLPGLQHAQIRGLLAEHLARVLPAAVSVAAPPTRAALTEAERTMLAYALNQAQLRMWSTGKYTDEDQAAVNSLRRLAEAPQPETQAEAGALAEARATNQRLNLRAQQLESELAAYRRAVRQWEVSERGTYIPHSSLRAIGKACGVDVLGTVRHLKHFERVEQAEAAIERVRRLHDALDAETALTSPDEEITRSAAARKIAAALDGWTAAAAPAVVAQPGTEPCGECPHPKDAHRDGDDPVTPGTCAACTPDEARHDWRRGRR